MKNIIFYVLGTIFSISLCIICLYYAFCIPTFSTLFYEYEYEKNGTYEILDIEEAQLMIATETMIDYLQDDRDDINVTVDINGEPTEIYNDREKSHMVDVKVLFENGRAYKTMSFISIFAIMFIFYITKTESKKYIARTNQFVFSSFIAMTIGLGIFALIDFNKIFTLFHKIFFSNDLWILDPSTSRIINMMPQTFFIDIIIIVTTIFLASCIGIIILSTLYLNKTKYIK